MIMNNINLIMLIFIFIGLILVIISFISDKKSIILHQKKNNPKICILIPARDESKVISNPLDSLKKQSLKIDFQDVYVIVEDKNDKTCDKVKQYNANIIIRKKPIIERKGFALDEAIKKIIKEKSYDLYFIIDADNILDKDFILNMQKAYFAGYDFGVCHRLSSNNSESVVACANGLTFSIIDLINKIKHKKNKNSTISGTGFFIEGSLVENKWKGYPFHELTEDYETTLYSKKENLSVCYIDNAIIYDEQPTTIKQSNKQKIRWIRGFLDSRKKYIDNKSFSKADQLGIIPYLFIIFGIIFIVLNNFILGITSFILNNKIGFNYLINNLIIILIVYLLVAFLTFIAIIVCNKDLKINLFMKIKLIIFHPIYLTFYIYSFIIALTKKNVSWDKIDHHDDGGLYE